jgi:hypothetical protein
MELLVLTCVKETAPCGAKPAEAISFDENVETKIPVFEAIAQPENNF